MLEKEGSNSSELDITVLEEGQQYYKTAYVYDIKAGHTKLDTGFYTLYLKDRNANTVIGRIFDLKDFKELGLNMLAFKRKAVRITFTAQNFNGSMSLVIWSIDYEKDYIDYRKFIGEVNGVKESEDFMNKVFTSTLSAEHVVSPIYRTTSIKSIAGGKCGGYMKVVHLALQRLLSYKDLPNINIKSICYILYKVQALYYNYLIDLETLDVSTTTNKYKELANISNIMEDKVLADEIVDVMGALFGLQKPERLLSNLIYSSLVDAIKDINMLDTYDSMILGARKEYDNKILFKF